MIFLSESDFIARLGGNILNQIIDNNTTLLDQAELQAVGAIKDLVSGMYDIDAEIAVTVEDERHQPLVLWLLSLACYQLYRQIPDDEVPARIIKDYDDTMDTLKQIGRGKIPTTLTAVELADGTSKRTFRMKSNTPRSHNML